MQEELQTQMQMHNPNCNWAISIVCFYDCCQKKRKKEGHHIRNGSLKVNWLLPFCCVANDNFLFFHCCVFWNAQLHSKVTEHFYILLWWEVHKLVFASFNF